jgi:hypothetical protein
MFLQRERLRVKPAMTQRFVILAQAGIHAFSPPPLGEGEGGGCKMQEKFLSPHPKLPPKGGRSQSRKTCLRSY